MTDNEAVNILVSGDTRIIDNMRLRRGMRVAAFYDANLPLRPFIRPQFRAELIVPLGRAQQVTLKYFDETLTAEDNSLKLNLSPFTNIETLNGRDICARRKIPSFWYIIPARPQYSSSDHRPEDRCSVSF